MTSIKLESNMILLQTAILFCLKSNCIEHKNKPLTACEHMGIQHTEHLENYLWRSRPWVDLAEHSIIKMNDFTFPQSFSFI